MKSVMTFLFIGLLTGTGYAYNIVCKAGNVTVRVQLESNFEHRMIILQGREMIATQKAIFCGQRSTPLASGGSCNSHLPVDGDRRYRTDSDFDLNFNYTTGKAPKNGAAGRATADIKSIFRNLATGKTEILELTQASCSVH